MEIKNKQALFSEISSFKKNAPIIKIKFIFIGLLIFNILMLGLIIGIVNIPYHVPEKIYEIANIIMEKCSIFLSILPFIFAAPVIIIDKKVDNIINNKISKYLGKDLQTNSEINPINFEIISNRRKTEHYKNSLKITSKINGSYPIFNFRTTPKLLCVLSCSYNCVNYEISILSIYWEKLKRRRKRTYIEDYGTDFFAILSITDKEFNNEPTELLKENKINYCGHQSSPYNKTDILLVERHKLNIHGKLESKIIMDIKLAEELIEKAIKLSENIIDNN